MRLSHLLRVTQLRRDSTHTQRWGCPHHHVLKTYTSSGLCSPWGCLTLEVGGGSLFTLTCSVTLPKCLTYPLWGCQIPPLAQKCKDPHRTHCHVITVNCHRLTSLSGLKFPLSLSIALIFSRGSKFIYGEKETGETS